MSTVYTSEPPTNGKVVIYTTKGELEVELWAKECPITVRNFVQLCMEGYYNNTIFHRLIKGFILQGGDPTGTGTGGECIYDKPFADEFHSRLRFTHRGLLAMANTGPQTNASQFFFTLDRTEDLNKRNTIFGKVVGDTLYNLVGMGEMETDSNERPLNPPKITKIEVLSNPFEDIVPRINYAELQRLEALKSAQLLASNQNSRKVKPKKNLALLSFEEDAQSEETSAFKIKSSHDLLENDPRLSRQLAVDDSSDNEGSEMVDSKGQNEMKDAQNMRKRQKVFEAPKESLLPSQERISGIRDQVQKVKDELKAMSKKESLKHIKIEKPVSLLAQMRDSYMKTSAIKSKGKKHTEDVISQLKTFSNTIKESKALITKKMPTDELECDLHFVKGCKSCNDTFGAEDEGDDEGWMAVELKFSKDVGANVYEPKVEDYTVVDPRAAVKPRADPFGRDAPSGNREWKDRSLPKT